MLQREKGPVTHEEGFLIAVEVQKGGPSPEDIRFKLADALSWVEGVGKTDVHYLGPVEQIDEEENVESAS